MSKKPLYQLQYENAKIENDVNTGCAVVTLVFLGFIVAIVIGIVILSLS